MAIVSIEDWKGLTCKSPVGVLSANDIKTAGDRKFMNLLRSRRLLTRVPFQRLHSENVSTSIHHVCPNAKATSGFSPPRPRRMGASSFTFIRQRDGKKTCWNSEYRFNSDLITVTSLYLLSFLVVDELRSLVMRLLRVIRGRGIHFCRRD